MRDEQQDAIALSESLLDLYLRYLDSAMPLRSDSLMTERRNTFARAGVIHQDPLIEFVPRYEETLDLPTACKRLSISNEFAEFAARGLFPKERRLYRHQFESLQAVINDGKHMAVTTGTGSGKTECFLFPIFEALLRESQSWLDNKRPRAIRALLMYPLNALAEDQMVRLRRAADSVDHTLEDGRSILGARSWLSHHRARPILFRTL